jgi:hypothetical protein
MVYDTLIHIVEKMKKHITEINKPDDVFHFLEKIHIVAEPKNNLESQIQLSERIIFMMEEKLNQVRIVKFPAMTVASFQNEGEAPELVSLKAARNLISANALDKRDGFRVFGFNNPYPSESNPIYGYEVWVTIPEDFEVPEGFNKFHVSDGLYASIPTMISDMGENYPRMSEWLENNEDYVQDTSRIWLEEVLDTDFFMTSENMDIKQMDILVPIMRLQKGEN